MTAVIGIAYGLDVSYVYKSVYVYTDVYAITDYKNDKRKDFATGDLTVDFDNAMKYARGFGDIYRSPSIDNFLYNNIEYELLGSHLIAKRVLEERHSEVQMDASGAIIAYKYLFKSKGKFYSPIYDEVWNNNSLVADEIPKNDNRNGIYAAKTHDSPVFNDYVDDFTLVKLLLSGKVIEYKYGYRAECADIIEVIKE